MSVILLPGLTAALYALLAWHFWRTRWTSPSRSQPGAAAWERAAVLVPLALHGYQIYIVLFAAPELRFGFSQALSVMMWLAVLIYWIESLYLNLEGMQVLLLAAAAACSMLPPAFPGLVTPSYTHSTEFRLHLTLAMFAYSLFTIAALHALLMTLLERRLHGRAVGGPLAALPPLLTMESILFRLIAVGFALLTMTLITGVAFSETLFHQPMKFNHKTLFAVISWIIFAALLVGRYLYGWRGRKALRWTLAGFASLLLAYVGSRFVLEVILGRTLS
jgi:ABC-type uncharacterized transport system permease subunit